MDWHLPARMAGTGRLFARAGKTEVPVFGGEHRFEAGSAAFMQHLSQRRGLLGEKSEWQSVFEFSDERLIVYGKFFHVRHVMELAVRRLRRNSFLRLSMAVLYQIRIKHSINRLIAACFQLVTLPRRVCPFNFPFFVGLVGYGVCVLRAFPFAGRTCRTRETRRTFDFQEGIA